MPTHLLIPDGGEWAGAEQFPLGVPFATDHIGTLSDTIENTGIALGDENTFTFSDYVGTYYQPSNMFFEFDWYQNDKKTINITIHGGGIGVETSIQTVAAGTYEFNTGVDSPPILPPSSIDQLNNISVTMVCTDPGGLMSELRMYFDTFISLEEDGHIFKSGKVTLL